MSKKLQISKRTALKGEDGYKTFSIRIKDTTVERLDQIAKYTYTKRLTKSVLMWYNKNLFSKSLRNFTKQYLKGLLICYSAIWDSRKRS